MSYNYSSYTKNLYYNLSKNREYIYNLYYTALSYYYYYYYYYLFIHTRICQPIAEWRRLYRRYDH